MNNLDNEFIKEYKNSCILCSRCKKFIYVNPTLAAEGWVQVNEFCKGLCKIDSDLLRPNMNYQAKRALRKENPKHSIPELKRITLTNFLGVYSILALLIIYTQWS